MRAYVCGAERGIALGLRALGPYGEACRIDTRGLLQRAHILAGEQIKIGKESDSHWEQGEDVSLLEFKAMQYRRRGNALATAVQLSRIEKVPKREFIRRGINQHTLEKICRKEPVRVSKLAKALKILQQWESENGGLLVQWRRCDTKASGAC